MLINEITDVLLNRLLEKHTKRLSEALPKPGEEFGDSVIKTPRDIKYDTVTFIGPNSSMWDPAMAKLFHDMEQSGDYDKDELWKRTGTIRTQSGSLAQEIDDSGARIKNLDFMNPNNFASGNSRKVVSDVVNGRTQGRSFKLGDILSHDLLFKAYPGLGDSILVTLWDNTDDKNTGGFYFRDHNGQQRIYVGVSDRPYGGVPDNDALFGPEVQRKILDVLAHEWQHAVQEIEPSLPQGGNTSSKPFLDMGKAIRAKFPDIETELTDGELAYYSLSGEQQAFQNDERRRYTDQERSERTPTFGRWTEIVTIEGDKLPDFLPDDTEYIVHNNSLGTYITFKNPDYQYTDDQYWRDHGYDYDPDSPTYGDEIEPEAPPPDEPGVVVPGSTRPKLRPEGPPEVPDYQPQDLPQQGPNIDQSPDLTANPETPAIDRDNPEVMYPDSPLDPSRQPGSKPEDPPATPSPVDLPPDDNPPNIPDEPKLPPINQPTGQPDGSIKMPAPKGRRGVDWGPTVPGRRAPKLGTP